MFKIWYEYDKEKKNISLVNPDKQISEKEKPIPNLLKNLKENKNIKLKKIDENGTEYYESNLCPNCVGQKEVIDKATYKKLYSCDLCFGTGFIGKSKRYKIHTSDYGKVLRRNYISAKNKKYLTYYGIDEEGNANIYINVDWKNKNALKIRGAKYMHSIERLTSLNPIEGYQCINLNIPLSFNEDGSVYVELNSKEINELKVEIAKIEEDLNTL